MCYLCGTGSGPSILNFYIDKLCNKHLRYIHKVLEKDALDDVIKKLDGNQGIYPSPLYKQTVEELKKRGLNV